jgi:cell division protein ZapD
MPLAEALNVLLGLLRDSGLAQKVVATGGQFQQTLPAGRSYQLLRVRINPELQLVPEISGHRLMVSVRFMQQDSEGRLKQRHADTTFELTLCV